MIPPRFRRSSSRTQPSLRDGWATRRLLGYEPKIDFEEGLRRAIEYYKEIANGESRMANEPARP